MENRIKECQLDLFSDRTSTASLSANHLMAVVRVTRLRAHDRPCGEWRCKRTELAKATAGTIRLKLLKRWSAGDGQRAAHQDRRSRPPAP